MSGEPKLARRRSGREYLWPKRPPYELAVPSSTTILNEGLPAPGLKFWAAKQAAEYAVEHHMAWKDLPSEDAVDLIKRAAVRYTERRADMGTITHAAIEIYLGTGVKRPLSEPVRSYVRAALRFLEAYEPEILRVEATVFSRQHQYAGTFDVLARYSDEPTSETATITDWKTSKAVYDKHVVQLVSYARADFIAGDDGHTEVALPEIWRGVVVLLRQDGTYEEYPYLMTDELFEVFLAARVVAERETRMREARETLRPRGRVAQDP